MSHFVVQANHCPTLNGFSWTVSSFHENDPELGLVGRCRWRAATLPRCGSWGRPTSRRARGSVWSWSQANGFAEPGRKELRMGTVDAPALLQGNEETLECIVVCRGFADEHGWFTYYASDTWGAHASCRLPCPAMWKLQEARSQTRTAKSVSMLADGRAFASFLGVCFTCCK